MRDCLCDKNDLIDSIDFYNEAINNKDKKIKKIKTDLDEKVECLTKDNESLINKTQKRIYSDIRTVLNAQYSLGLDCNEMEELYTLGIKYISEITKDLAYFNILRYISLGILLGVERSVLQPLVSKLDSEKFDDILFDYILNAYGINRAYKSTGVAYPNPYRLLIDIIETAKTDKNKASQLLKEYTEKKWIDGHADCGWKTFHKEPGYTGLWSYDAGVVAKILNLDDSELKTSIHYPYDLVHYKNDLKLTEDYMIEEQVDDLDEFEYVYGIANNPAIEQIIPVKFHEIINNVIDDYNSLDDRAMWEKYQLQNIWFTLEEYVNDKKDGLLGFIIIHVLISRNYIIQIDGKEDIEDYVENMPNLWNTDDIKVVSFDLKNDQIYLAKVPSNIGSINVYEVSTEKVNRDESLN